MNCKRASATYHKIHGWEKFLVVIFSCDGNVVYWQESYCEPLIIGPWWAEEGLNPILSFLLPPLLYGVSSATPRVISRGC